MFSIKLQSSFIEITLWHECSPVYLLHILRTPFLKNLIGLDSFCKILAKIFLKLSLGSKEFIFFFAIVFWYIIISCNIFSLKLCAFFLQNAFILLFTSAITSKHSMKTAPLSPLGLWKLHRSLVFII